MARLLLGQHPQGPYGLFISKPGVAVESTAPTDTNNLLFSSEWGGVANIVQAGTTPLNTDVVMPSLGYRPFVRVDDPLGTSYMAYTKTGRTSSVGNGTSRRYDWTRFKIVYSSDTVFQVQAAQSDLELSAPTGLTFRYCVLNFPVLS